MIAKADPLLRFAVERALDAQLAADALPAVWPIVQKAKLGRYDLRTETVFDAERLRESIAGAVRLPVRAVGVLVTTRLFDPAHVRCNVSLPYAKSLTVRLNDAWYERVKNAYARRFNEPAWPVFKEELHERIRETIAEPLGIKDLRGLVVDPASSVGESLLASIFHFVSALIVADEDAVAAIRPLIVDLATTIPVGETDRDEGVWLSVLVPMRRGRVVVPTA